MTFSTHTLLTMLAIILRGGEGGGKLSTFTVIYEARVRFEIQVWVRVRVRQDSAINKLLKIFLFIYFIYAKHDFICNNNRKFI